MFINIGAIFAPFAAVGVRNWWLSTFGYNYDADLPALCHGQLAGTLSPEATETYHTLVTKASTAPVQDYTAFASDYLNVFTTGFHYAFGVAIIAMAISLTIYWLNKKNFPDPSKKTVASSASSTVVEMSAQEVKQRMYALFAVFGVVIFFWFSFHQNGTSLSLFARDFVDTSTIAPEIWQAVNPFFVITLTPVIMMIFGSLSRRGKEISTPRKIAIGMLIAGLAYLFLSAYSLIMGYPSAAEYRELPIDQQVKAGAWVLIVLYFLLTVAELFISPLGLSFVSKVAPKHLLGLCQGLWLGATAVGNLLLWIGPLMYNAIPIGYCWAIFMIVCLISMGVMLFMVKWLERVAK